MKRLKLLLFFLIWLFLSTPLSAQIKPSAMLLPIYFVELDKSSLQNALNNYVQTELSAYYDLKSEKEVEQARDAAIDSLSSNNCTEEACIKVMGELLDVEYTFSLEIIDTGEGWDITAVRLDLDGETARDNVLCGNCNLSKTRTALTKILTALRPGEMLLQRGKASLRLESTPKARVFLNGRDQGQTPLNLSVDARKTLDILLVAKSYNDFSESYVLEPGKKYKKQVNLVRKRGNIRLLSDPAGAKIFIDGKAQVAADGSTETTPADLRITYGSHKISLEYPEYEELSQSLTINKPNHKNLNFILQPKPGRVVVRVPAENTQARIFVNGDSVGSMRGNIVRSFDLASNQSLSIQVKDGLAISEEKNVWIEPGGSKNLSFNILQIPEGSGQRYGLGLEYEQFSMTFKGDSSKTIQSDYALIGLDFHTLLLPQRVLFSLKWLSGDGTITEPVPPFYLVDGTQMYQITGTKAEVWRFLVSPSWSSGWNYAFGLEQITFTFLASQGNLKAVRNSPLIEGGYEFSKWADWMMDNGMLLETRARYSQNTGIALILSFGVIFP